MARRVCQERAAFTLIELLVVVAIISVLASMLLPALSRARDQARLSVCSSNLKQLGLGMTLYAADWDGHLPVMAFPNNKWMIMAADHLGYPAVASMTSEDTAANAMKLLQCPNTYRPNAGRSYGLNQFICTLPYAPGWQYNCPQQVPLRADAAPDTSTYAMGGESISHPQLMPSWGHGSALNGIRTLFPRLHVQKRNYVLADGHVEPTVAYGKTFFLAYRRASTSGPCTIPTWGRDNHSGQGEIPPYY